MVASFAVARLEVEGDVPSRTRRAEVLAALARGLESTGRFAKVVVRPAAVRRAATVLVRIDRDDTSDPRRTGYGLAYRVVGPDGALVQDVPREGFAFGFEGKAFADMVELDARLRLANDQHAEGSFVASTRHFIERRWKDTRDRRLGHAALDAFERASSRRNPSRTDLAPVVVAARSPHKGVFDVGGAALARLAASSKVAQTALRELALSKNANERLVAIAYLGPALPRPFLVEMLRLGLRDGSDRIRDKAAERCAGGRVTELLSELASAEHLARRGSSRDWISLMRDLTRRGHAVRKDGRGRRELVVVGANGMSHQAVDVKDTTPARLRRLVRAAQRELG